MPSQRVSTPSSTRAAPVLLYALACALGCAADTDDSGGTDGHGGSSGGPPVVTYANIDCSSYDLTACTPFDLPENPGICAGSCDGLCANQPHACAEYRIGDRLVFSCEDPSVNPVISDPFLYCCSLRETCSGQCYGSCVRGCCRNISDFEGSEFRCGVCGPEECPPHAPVVISTTSGYRCGQCNDDRDCPDERPTCSRNEDSFSEETWCGPCASDADCTQELPRCTAGICEH